MLHYNLKNQSPNQIFKKIGLRITLQFKESFTKSDFKANIKLCVSLQFKESVTK